MYSMKRIETPQNLTVLAYEGARPAFLHGDGKYQSASSNEEAESSDA